MINITIDNSKRVEEDFSAFLTFPYNTDILTEVRALSERYWHNESKEWEVPFSKLAKLISKLNAFEIEIKLNIDIVTAEKKAETPANFSFKTKPFDHQIDGFNYGLNHDRWFLGDEQGLGKTKQVIDIAVAKKLQYGFKHCLIICGVNGLKWNWQREISIHSNESGYILGQRHKGNKIVIGSTADKLNDIKSLADNPNYFIITNVESLRNSDIQAKLGLLCHTGEIGIVAIDEIHKCKNPSSQQGKGILKLQPKCRIAMTGTPLMNTPLDLYIILRWLGYENNAFYKFKNHYCDLGGFGGYEIVGYKHLNELQEKLNDIMLRRLKADVLDLPDKLRVDEYVEMTAKQEIIYKEVSAVIKSNIDQIKTSANPLAELIRLRQATGYTGILSSTIQESAKLDRMEELVEEAVSNNKKVVIFSNWTQMTDAIQSRLSAYNPAVITGQTNDADRQTLVEKFQNSNNCKVMVGTIGAMGTGLTLTAGTVEIFMDEPWNMALKEQAEDRCHRIGAKENVTIYTLIAKDTIDERIHALVYDKGALSNAIVDGKATYNKSALVDYLVS